MSALDAAVRHFKRNGLLYAGLLLAGLISTLAWQNATLKREKTEVLRTVRYAHEGMWIPDFIAPTVDGGQVRVGGANGKRQVLIYLSPTCKFCVQSMPFIVEMDRFAKTYGDLEVVGLTRTNDFAMAQFVKKYDIKFPVAVVAEDRLVNLLKFGPTPAFLTVDKLGRVSYAKIGMIESSKDAALIMLHAVRTEAVAKAQAPRRLQQ